MPSSPQAWSMRRPPPALFPLEDMGLLSPSSRLPLALLEVTAGPSPRSPCPGRPGGLRLGVPVVQGTDPSAVIHGSPPCPALASPAPGRSRCPGVGVVPGCAATVLVKPGREGTFWAGVSGGTLWGRCFHQPWARSVWGQLMAPQSHRHRAAFLQHHGSALLACCPLGVPECAGPHSTSSSEKRHGRVSALSAVGRRWVPLFAVRQLEPCFAFPSARSEVEVEILQGG